MKRRQPEIGDVVKIISDYAEGDATVPQYGDMGVVTDHEQDSNGLCWCTPCTAGMSFSKS